MAWLFHRSPHFLLLVWILASVSTQSVAFDRVFAIPVKDSNDIRHEHNYELLALALEASEDRYGAYEISRPKHLMTNDRILPELIKGEHLSVGVSMLKTSWEGKTNIVPYPILKGLASYRLFFSTAQNQYLLENATTIQDLQQYKFGQGRGWSTVQILQDNGFKIVYGDSYSGMFKMLGADRFDFLMRGVYEISIELKIFSKTVPGLTVADGVALFTYLPMYFHVTKSQPLLAERIEYGLKKIHESGAADVLFDRYFKSAIEWLKLRERKVFYIENTNLKNYPGLYERDKPYLLDVIKDNYQIP